MMNEFLYLDFNNITDIVLVGIDYDANILQVAQILAEKKRIN